MTETELLKSFDAQVWAREFVRIVTENPTIPTDEGTMIAWFANALMRGYDEHRWAHETKMREFAGWLSADIPELHNVEVPRLAESLERFQAL